MQPRSRTKPLISIVTVVLNARTDLQQTAASVAEQGLYSVEHIVIDGGSTDGTVTYLSGVNWSHLVWKSERDDGIYDAMNKGLELASGDWVLFLNAGDTLASPKTLQQLGHEISLVDDQIVAIAGKARVWTLDGRFRAELGPLRFTRRNLNRYATRVVCHQALLVRRASAPSFSSRYRLKGELDWYFRLLEKSGTDSIQRVPMPICNYRYGGVGDVQYWTNLGERLLVTLRHNGSLTTLLLSPFFVLSMAFRLRRLLMGR